jgi:hypothetical protein
MVHTPHALIKPFNRTSGSENYYYITYGDFAFR